MSMSQSMIDLIDERIARLEQHRVLGHDVDGRIEELRRLRAELERRAEPTLDELFAKAREQHGDICLFFQVEDDNSIGAHITFQETDDSWHGLAWDYADTAIGALRAAVEGR